MERHLDGKKIIKEKKISFKRINSLIKKAHNIFNKLSKDKKFDIKDIKKKVKKWL